MVCVYAVLETASGKTCTRYKIGINAEKTKLMKNKCQWHPERDQGKRAEAGYTNNL